MLAAETACLYFEDVPAPLREIMWRVGASASPMDFVFGVVDAWRAVEIVSEEQVQERFRATRAYRDFRQMLRRAARPGARTLAIGCGRGLAGRTSGYAASVVREIFSSAESAGIDRLDLTPQTLAVPGGPYDLVVTHSLLHFVYDFRPLCRLIASAVAPGGAYVMANEPNARFWSNPECVRELDRVAGEESREKRLRKLISPASYWNRLARLGKPTPRWSDRINQILRDRLHLTGSLTEKEIVRIVDPFVCDAYPGQCAIGADGIDAAELERDGVMGLRLERQITSGYVFRSNPDRVPERWRASDERLAREYPLDGCSLTALWRKDG